MVGCQVLATMVLNEITPAVEKSGQNAIGLDSATSHPFHCPWGLGANLLGSLGFSFCM